MIELNEAKFIAEQYLIKLKDQFGEPLQLVKTQEESFGWVFFELFGVSVKTRSMAGDERGPEPKLARKP